jgi:hypothetical protein
MPREITLREVFMAIAFNPQQVGSFKELLMSQVVQQEPLLGCLWRKGYSVVIG